MTSTREGVVIGFAQAVREQLETMPISVAVVALLIMLLVFNTCSATTKDSRRLTQRRSMHSEDAVGPWLKSTYGAPDEPHEEGFTHLLDGSAFLIGNGEPCPFETEFASGSILAIHQITYDTSRYPNGSTRYEDYFTEKKRIWETRLQFKFKKEFDSSRVFFGIECSEYVPLNFASRKSMDLIVAGLKQVVGNQIYHTSGDNPKKFPGVSPDDLEKPQFVMPLWAFDQFIVSEEGEEPPDIRDTSDDFGNRGEKRSGNEKAYAREINGLKIKPGPTFTFSFWGISRWLDKLNWDIINLGRKDMNEFCGRPPVRLVIYQLKDSCLQNGNPKTKVKHIHRNRDIIFEMVFWSSIDRPGDDDGDPRKSKEKILELMNGPACPGLDSPLLSRREPQNSEKGNSMFCCTGR